jgi:hypothetical protein
MTELFESKKNELIAVASAMLVERINLIEGVRRICSLRFAAGDPENDVFMPLRAIDSETDHFPLGEMRARCSADYLRRMDAEMQDYLSDARPYILEACKEIINTFS